MLNKIKRENHPKEDWIQLSVKEIDLLAAFVDFKIVS